MQGYAVAVTATALAWLLTQLIHAPWVEPNKLLLFIAAVTLSSWYAGLGPGLLATLLSAVAGTHFLISTDYATHVSLRLVVVQLAEFILLSLLICLLNAARLSAQRRTEAARAEAEAANRARDVFIAHASHELRTPLTSIVGWMRLLRHNLLPEAERARALEIVARNARVQSMLVDDLLDASRIATGKLHLNHETVDLTVVLTDALNIVRPTAEEKGVKVDTTVRQRSVQTLGDYDRLQQILWNLLSNAVKFTPAGGSIKVLLDAADGQARVSVRDTGMGIKPEILPHIFESFRQDEAARSHRGLGLGLSIARSLAESHGGSISAESEGEGFGSTFTLTLPLLLTVEGKSLEATSSFDSGSDREPNLASKEVRALTVHSAL
jgi:signal transduction histidine kinase